MFQTKIVMFQTKIVAGASKPDLYRDLARELREIGRAHV